MSTEFDQKAQQAEEHFQEVLHTFRTGRAHPSLVEQVMVDSYGAQTPLKQVANIGVSDAKTLTIEPWDKSLVKEIEKGLVQANLNVSPVVDGSIIRMVLPEMTEETRKDMVKKIKEKLEEARVSIRNARDATKKAIEQQEKNGELTEDDKRDAVKELDEKTKQANEALEAIADKKESEIMTV